jgi:xylulose-5-phosphate/fructose-6-phosphate phosphoketolase
VLPILHLNGYKIASPTVLARIDEDELRSLLIGYGYRPYLVEGSEPEEMHRLMAATLDAVFDEIAAIQAQARAGGELRRPRWPMIVLRTPKGWTGPKEVEGQRTEGSWRSHQVPLNDLAAHPSRIEELERWMRSYRPEELFDEARRIRPEIRALAPAGPRRMGANPHANGGLLRRDLRMPDVRDYAVPVPEPGRTVAEATRVLGAFLRDVMRLNEEARNFRVFAPDELVSNRLGALLEVTDRAWMARVEPGDDHLSPGGRVTEMLSEHACQGWLEGYLLTGRHGLFTTYEAFVHIVDAMFNQHAKWLKVSREIPWRAPIASLNYLLSSHVWRQDHNGFSHQDPRVLGRRRQQEGGGDPGLPPARCEHAPGRDRHVPAEPRPGERRRRRQAPRPAVPRHGERDSPLHGGRGDLGVGEQRPGRGAGRRHGLLRRRAHARDAGRRRHPAAAPAGAARTGGQRGRPDAAPAR